MGRIDKRIIKRFFLCFLCSSCIAVIMSLGMALFDYLQVKDNRGKYAISDENIYCNKKLVKEQGKYKISKKNDEIVIKFLKKTYINKLQYRYLVAESIDKNCKIKVYMDNIYGDETVKKIEDNYFKGMSRSVVNIKGNVTKIVFKFPTMNSEMELYDFVIDNRFKWNPYLFVIINTFIFVILFVILFRKEGAEHPGAITFICINVIAICMLILQTPYCSGWDEEIHFSRCYNMAITFDSEEGAPSVIDYLVDNYAWLDLHHEMSIEERIDMIRNMNYLGEIRGAELDTYIIQINSIGYVFQVIAITIGRFLGLPFYCVWTMGRLANVFLYSIGMSLAISIIPIGKRLLMLISLAPTMIFLSTTYTYDVSVIVFLILGSCIWIKEIVSEDTVFSYRSRALYILCMIVGCMPKAVYIPMILGAFFLPSKKFYSSKDKYIFKGIIVLCLCLLMSTFILPTLTNPTVGGDVRGGDTSVSRQLEYVLHKPLAYGVVLLNNIRKKWISYTTGGALGYIIYFGKCISDEIYTILLVGVAITDTYSEKQGKTKYTFKSKIISAIMISVTIVLIWTALYLSFTEVGQTKIAGVQGRYYLPFIFLIYLWFRNEKIENRFSIYRYQLFVVLISCIMVMCQIADSFFAKCCI
ncbi:DUF2142 domain-containing protein [Sporofaciens musculi]|uniref:DUF2142 domain-containing protein n=1 Tax=Sporofaciens musculi TaxID=2681861 RepID=UPI0025A1BD86|nr:DUF2142 domain-containing protein [Sporofaciens musculi]